MVKISFGIVCSAKDFENFILHHPEETIKILRGCNTDFEMVLVMNGHKAANPGRICSTE